MGHMPFCMAWRRDRMVSALPNSRNEFLTKNKVFLTKRRVRVVTPKQLMVLKIRHFKLFSIIII